MRRLTRPSWPLAVSFFLAVCTSELLHGQTPLEIQIRALPHVLGVKVQTSNRGPSGVLELTFQQPVDHARPLGAKFEQRVFISHSGFDEPVILGTEGYSARGVGSGGELRRMLGKPNLVTVEHRYFGRSIPTPLDWKQLTVRNAAADMHEIVTSLKRLYHGKWVATGASKGGQTALFYKCFYPHDVDATVAYVAPINLGQEDPRISKFMETVGDAPTRTLIKEFQIALLKREDEILPLLKADPAKYSMGVAKAYEFGVLEFPYGFWQYGSNTKVDSVPGPDAPASALAAAYKAVNAMYYYSDAGIKQFEAFQYQAFTEIGYYNYDITDFKAYLRANPNPTNKVLCPQETQNSLIYNPATMAFVFETLQYRAENVVYVYGETDAWSATQMQLLGRTNSFKIVVKGAWHNATIHGASAEQKLQFLTALESWLGLKLNRD